MHSKTSLATGSEISSLRGVLAVTKDLGRIVELMDAPETDQATGSTESPVNVETELEKPRCTRDQST